MKRYLAMACALIAAAAFTPVQAQTPATPSAPPPAVREITKIAGEVYRFRNNNHFSVFAVTPAGWPVPGLEDSRLS